MVLDREMRAEGWMISLSRLRHFPESTPIPTTSRLGEMIESTRRSVRVDSNLQGLQGVENKKKAPIHQNRRPNNHEKVVEGKNLNLPNRRRNCCHHHPHQSSRCHRYR